MSLMDGFGRKIDYLRLSVTDRCDFRCVYCMSENPTFLRRDDVLTLEELSTIARAFTELGVERIRLTGGEPLVRTDLPVLVRKLGKLPGLKDLSMTTNGSRLTKFADVLAGNGLQRLNISLDTLEADRFAEVTRKGNLERVLAGIDSATKAGFERVKLNAVIMKGQNDHEVLDLVNFARDKGCDISFIEEMPLGAIEEERRDNTLCTSDEVRALIEPQYPLTASSERTGGPARYYKMADSDIRIGFISPHSHNFCHECNRVRVTVKGELLLCLGNENSVDLKQVLRDNDGDVEAVKAAVIKAMKVKPEKHLFGHEDGTQILRFMSLTGG
ncbi:GTP 3',8-cyclase MoaA [Ferrimonas aestuarii]|uniref:GTP 3',8-cyclase n=1 Tax=Ferrimonas aestuarii TaxID=2569539 RepID=A0A4U1BMV7_9GAMM|nr:GTP 3',8-cyclase MoaA [Ferrimonas aestuarii]TKB55009.1 GTP 3',8-cyclase MoaA [Ferrimonas aestuarii]